jgi:MoxR-like ATPase
MAGNRVKVLQPDRLNGDRRTGKGVYVPTKKSISKTLEGFIPKKDELPPYVSQGNELKIIEAARKGKKAVLLSGPTGVGKTLLAMRYAANNNLPCMLFVSSEDSTDFNMRGSSLVQLAPIDVDGQIHDGKFQVFSPTQISLAAMADEPVVLFLDELHKIRPGAAGLIHGLTNPNERMLYCYDLCGENFSIHPETLVMAAVNPNYGESGIEQLDAALRRRFSTISLEMPNEEKLSEIVLANVGDLDKNTTDLVKHIAKITVNIGRARDSFEGISSTTVDAPRLDSGVLSSIIEVPSPASLVETIKDVLNGLPVMDAIEVNMINTIVTDFGQAQKSLMEFVRDSLPRKVLGE